MGLDVYLYKYDNYDETNRKQKEFEEKSESLWERPYESYTEIEKKAVREKQKALAAEMDLDEWGDDKTYKHKIEIDSDIDPEHYFKMGYFRSSYNNGGINKVLKNLGLPDLYYIFSNPTEYIIQPNWTDALTKCNEVIELLTAKGDYRCHCISQNIFIESTVHSEKEAIDVLLNQIKEGRTGSYSCRDGEFYLDEPIEVIALVPGTQTLFSQAPCTYVITKEKGANDWYIKALKIVRQTIQYVLDQPDIEKYYLHWSS